MSSYVVAALYKFTTIEHPDLLKQQLDEICVALQLRGTLLIAKEGINGTIAGTAQQIEQLLQSLRADARFNGLEVKYAQSDKIPFLRMKVRLKKEIVTMGIPSVDPNKVVGEYVEPKDWNSLISDAEVTVIDTRNQYEVDIGSFAGAINPGTENFRDFPAFVAQNLDPKKHKKVAMFCTGGIRCEKATAYLRQQGFEHVFHLKGGILKYLEQIPQQQSLWHGECFVFDERVAVNHQLEQGRYTQCFGCRHPLDENDRQSPDYKPGVHCPHCVAARSATQHACAQERQRQIELARTKQQPHIGPQAQPPNARTPNIQRKQLDN